MANPVCTRNGLAATNPGFGLDGLDKNQYTAALIRLKVLELAAIGGTDYRTSMKTQLINDAVNLASTMNPDERRIARLQIARNNAVAAGATVPSTISALNAQTACCFQSYDDLDAILILLDCKLGVSKAYPQ